MSKSLTFGRVSGAAVFAATIIGLFLLATVQSASAAVGGPTCNVPADYATIQGAVNDAGCTTINVAAGTYTEHVAVNRAVTLNGANAGTAGNGARGAESIVDGTDTDAAFAITANGVTIDGFTVKNGSNGGYMAGIWSQSGTQNSSIINNIITQNAIGVWAQCGGNCLIQNNLFDANNKTGPSGGSGISADGTTGLTINNNEFKGHTAGNPILMQAVAPGAHTNLVVTNNNFHDNAFTNVYALAITGGTFSGNTITPASDSTGISLSGANANITITDNVITGGLRGVRVEDLGYYGGSGGNSNVTVNRNNVSGNSGYGVGNTDAAITSLNAECNWWGSASGPGPVGPGSGSPVTANVDYQPWLTSGTDIANAPCNGPIASTVDVTIIKYVDGAHATEANADSATFPMQATYDFTNDQFPGGIAGTDPFDVGPTGNNTPNAYEAKTLDFYQGADYSMYERMDTAVVGATCQDGKPFALEGYKVGDTLVDAQGAIVSATAPSFTDMQSDKYVIVSNVTCVAPTPDVKVTINKFIDGAMATAVSADNSAFPMSATWNATNIGAGSGNFDLDADGFNGDPTPYQAITSMMTSGADYSTNEVTGGSVVGATCQDGKPYALAGYSVGDSLAAAQAAPTTAQSPVLTNITTDKYIIVRNVTCAEEPPVDPVPPANACATPGVAPEGYTLQNGTSGSNTVTLAPNTMFVGKGGNDKVTGGDGNYIVCTAGGNDTITLGNGNSTIDAGGGNNTVTVGNGEGTIKSAGGNDIVTAGNGARTISVGGGNNKVISGDGVQTITAAGGNDEIKAGAGNDNVNAGGGNNKLWGEGGDDMLTTAGGNDLLDGGSDTDTCQAGGGTNTKISCEI